MGEVDGAATAAEFRRRMDEFRRWCDARTWAAPVHERLEKLWNKTESYVVAYDHPGCHRTSNPVDRPMNRLYRLVYAGRGLHGHQHSSERRLRGWAPPPNFRPLSPPAHRPPPPRRPPHP